MLDFDTNKLEVFYSLCNKYPLQDLQEQKFFNVPVLFSNRMTSAAGQAQYMPMQIKLSNPIYQTITPSEKINTFKHELIHIYAFLYFNNVRQGHNRNWQNMMILAGLEPKRCHNYKVKKRKITKNYYLACICGFTFDCTARRYNSFYDYLCPDCENTLTKHRK